MGHGAWVSTSPTSNPSKVVLNDSAEHSVSVTVGARHPAAPATAKYTHYLADIFIILELDCLFQHPLLKGLMQIKIPLEDQDRAKNISGNTEQHSTVKGRTYSRTAACSVKQVGSTAQYRTLENAVYCRCTNAIYRNLYHRLRVKGTQRIPSTASAAQRMYYVQYVACRYPHPAMWLWRFKVVTPWRHHHPIRR
jgi:hypothetical protein